MGIVELRLKNDEPNVDSLDLALRRLAVVITAQLPDDPIDAVKVLDLSRRLILDFVQA